MLKRAIVGGILGFIMGGVISGLAAGALGPLLYVLFRPLFGDVEGLDHFEAERIYILASLVEMAVIAVPGAIVGGILGWRGFAFGVRRIMPGNPLAGGIIGGFAGGILLTCACPYLGSLGMVLVRGSGELSGSNEVQVFNNTIMIITVVGLVMGAIVGGVIGWRGSAVQEKQPDGKAGSIP